MSAPAAASAEARPAAMSTRAGLALVAASAALFVALLWMIGTGWGVDSNDGAGHAGGKGLNGFAGLVRLAAADGWDTTLARDDIALDQPGLLVLSPAADAPGPAIADIVSRHRRIGPVMVIAPKWQVARLDRATPGAKPGWVALVGQQPPGWHGFLDGVSVTMISGAKGAGLRWRGVGPTGAKLTGRLPDRRVIEVGGGRDDAGEPLIPLVRITGGAAPGSGAVLAAYVGRARRLPALDRLALDPNPGKPLAGALKHDPLATDYPLVLVFEPDLLDNYGLADPANVALAGSLLAAMAGTGPRAIAFDVTLNGLGRARNLLTLVFTPPYLAATLCLILAGVAAGWRSFCRFGAPRTISRDLAFGKQALVANGGALILRARRMHLLGSPYVAACRDRIARQRGLPHHGDVTRTDAAIDRALAARQSAGNTPRQSFAETAQSLRRARSPAAIVTAARALHDLERMLIR